MAMAAMPVTKLLASFSMASPLKFSGAPVAVLTVPRRPAGGGDRSPVWMWTRDGGDGGNMICRAVGDRRAVVMAMRRVGIR